MKKTEFIYRVEHRTLKLEENDEVFLGPYRSKGEFSSMFWLDSIVSSSNKPTPDKEEFPMLTWGSHYFGFSSQVQIFNWFSYRELNNLVELGFIIAKYETQEVVKGKTQSIFIPTKKPREIIEIKSLY